LILNVFFVCVPHHSALNTRFVACKGLRDPFNFAAPKAVDDVNILVLGATGLLGNAVFRSLSRMRGAQVTGTIRQDSARRLFDGALAAHLTVAGNIEDPGLLTELFDAVRPDVVVNCVAVGRPAPADPMRSIAVYAVLPHRLSHLCKLAGARLIQISSDGVFSGHRGTYTEADVPDADDVYGTSKFLGEVDAPHAVTLRTSIIGHELQGGSGLLEWFLSQQGECRCFTRAIFSGFPTIVLADMIRDIVLPRPDLSGIYHVATRPISKFDLLLLVAERYGKRIKLLADDRPAPDRSLVADRFERLTGYKPPDWPALVDAMYRDKFSSVGHDEG
jgi:dTDP-4-dehydrorhamnose reductase